MRMKRAGPNDMRMLIEFVEPDPQTVVFEKTKVQIYFPKMQTVQVYDLGKHRSLVDQFLLLGFGSSGKELARNYNLKVSARSKSEVSRRRDWNWCPSRLPFLSTCRRPNSGSPRAATPFSRSSTGRPDDYTLITYRECS